MLSIGKTDNVSHLDNVTVLNAWLGTTGASLQFAAPSPPLSGPCTFSFSSPSFSAISSFLCLVQWHQTHPRRLIHSHVTPIPRLLPFSVSSMAHVPSFRVDTHGRWAVQKCFGWVGVDMEDVTSHQTGDGCSSDCLAELCGVGGPLFAIVGW